MDASPPRSLARVQRCSLAGQGNIAPRWQAPWWRHTWRGRRSGDEHRSTGTSPVVADMSPPEDGGTSRRAHSLWEKTRQSVSRSVSNHVDRPLGNRENRCMQAARFPRHVTWFAASGMRRLQPRQHASYPPRSLPPWRCAQDQTMRRPWTHRHHAHLPAYSGDPSPGKETSLHAGK